MISVIIPTFNRGNLLPRATESVLAQSFTDFELIIVDDGSVDDTHSVVHQFRDSRLRLVTTVHNGVSAARNRGIHCARNNWIAFLDSDDTWEPNKLRLQVEALEANPNYLITYTDESWIRDNLFVNQRKAHKKYSGWIFHRCLPLCIVSPSSVLLHRKILREVGLFDVSYPVCEDYDLWLRLTSRYPVLFLPQKLIKKFGGHQDQLSKSTWGLDRFRIQSMVSLLRSQHLTPSQRRLTAFEVLRKAQVVSGGAKKRGNPVLASRYRDIAESAMLLLNSTR